MTELLFKLKLQGKCVGYMRIASSEVFVRKTPNDDWKHRYYGSEADGFINVRIPLFDEMCLFICKDRQGRDVFEGDKVSLSLFGESQGTGEALMKPQIAFPLSDYTRYLSPCECDIELIEEQP